MNNRRNFFKQIAGDVVRGVQEITGPPASPDLPVPPLAPIAPTEPEPLEPATGTARGATLDELLALADRVGLGARRDAVRALARASMRLTPADEDNATLTLGASRLGGAPDLAESESWPHWRGTPLTFLLQLDLAEVAATLAGCGTKLALPGEGTLACFAAAAPPSGMRPDDAGACAALLTTPTPGAQPAYGQPVVLSGELMLPRPWSPAVRALGLSADESEAWILLRRELATAQGVEPFDEPNGREAPHRLLGLAEERRGEMPLACALLAEGLDPGNDPPSRHARAEALEPEAARWTLLLQLVPDERVDWSWGERRERLYVWAHEDDLAVRDLSRLRAFVQ